MLSVTKKWMAEPRHGLVPSGTLLIGICYGLARFSYGLFLPQFQLDIGLSSAISGFIGSCAYIGYCIAIVSSAFLAERFGARYVAVGAALIAAVGMGLVAVSTTPVMLASAMLLAGLSTGFSSPPMVKAVAYAVPSSRQARANTIINAGTGIGIAFAPISLIALGQWRIAYAIFSAIALGNALWLIVTVPETRLYRAPHGQVVAMGNTGNPTRRPAIYLVIAAMGMGIASAAFWTFSSEVIIVLGHHGQNLANLVWIIIGLAGLIGATAGDLVYRFGINLINRASLTAMALVLLLYITFPGNYTLIFISAAVFGTVYITLTGIYLIWGIRVYSDRPAIGLAVPFLMIAVGQIIGSPLAGYLIGQYGFRVCFIIFSALAVATSIIPYPGN